MNFHVHNFSYIYGKLHLFHHKLYPILDFALWTIDMYDWLPKVITLSFNVSIVICFGVKYGKIKY